MYNFSSEGAYSDHEAQFALIGPTPDEVELKDLNSIRDNIKA